MLIQPTLSSHHFAAHHLLVKAEARNQVSAHLWVAVEMQLHLHSSAELRCNLEAVAPLPPQALEARTRGLALLALAVQKRQRVERTDDPPP